MNTEHPDFDRALRQWFEDGPTVMNDRVVDGIASRIARQPQRRARRLQRRPFMTTYTRLAAAAAAVIVVGVVGWRLLPGPGGDAGTPTATPLYSPASSASASTASTATSVCPPWYTAACDGSGILSAGSQTTQRFLPGSTLTVPAGWVNDADNAQLYTLFPNSAANEAEYALSGQTRQNIIFAATVGNNMFTICGETGLFPAGAAADVIDAVRSNEALTTTKPIDITVGGLSGQWVDVRLDPRWAGSCAHNENDPPTKDYGDVRNRLILLDVPGRGPLGVAISSEYSADFEVFVADAMPIVESFEFNGER
jgi:hypothetical protein